MKVRLPNMGGGPNLQQLAAQAQKMQEEMAAKNRVLEDKIYTATSGGGAVTVEISGKMEVKKIEISPDAIDPDDAELLSDMIMGAVNEALSKATTEKDAVMDGLSSGLNFPGF